MKRARDLPGILGWLASLDAVLVRPARSAESDSRVTARVFNWAATTNNVTLRLDLRVLRSPAKKPNPSR